jgi:hypothetical protein
LHLFIISYSLHLFINLHRLWSDTGTTELLGFRNKLSWQVTWMQSTLFGIKFETPQAWSSWYYLLFLTSKFQLHNALRIPHLTVEAMFSTL